MKRSRRKTLANIVHRAVGRPDWVDKSTGYGSQACIPRLASMQSDRTGLGATYMCTDEDHSLIAPLSVAKQGTSCMASATWLQVGCITVRRLDMVIQF